MALLSAVLALPLAHSPAFAVGTDRHSPEETLLRSQLVAAGVDARFHDGLVEAALDGKVWEAATGVDPVSVSTRTKDGYEVTLHEFSDGSRIEFGVEIGVEATESELAEIVNQARPYVEGTPAASDHGRIAEPDGLITPFATGISGCTYGTSAGVYYASNCHVYYHGINWSSSFNADYQRWSGNAKAQYRNGTAKTVTWLGVSNELVQSLDSSRRIRYSLNLSAAGWGNAPFRLDLVVTPTTAYATYS